MAWNFFKEKGLGNIPDLSYTKWSEGGGAKAYVPYIISGSYSNIWCLNSKNWIILWNIIHLIIGIQFKGPYELSVIQSGLKKVEDRTRIENRDCVKFVSRTNELTYLNVVRENGCWSYIGKQRLPGKQSLSLGNGCLYEMTVAHEFMHALGIWHEQSRWVTQALRWTLWVTKLFFLLND